MTGTCNKICYDAVILIKIRDDLQTEVDSRVKRATGTTIGITNFNNWGLTKDSLLPLVEHVVTVVKSIKGMKVLHNALQIIVIMCYNIVIMGYNRN